jgi:hypothetical protein
MDLVVFVPSTNWTTANASDNTAGTGLTNKLEGGMETQRVASNWGRRECGTRLRFFGFGTSAATNLFSPSTSGVQVQLLVVIDYHSVDKTGHTPAYAEPADVSVDKFGRAINRIAKSAPTLNEIADQPAFGNWDPPRIPCRDRHPGHAGFDGFLSFGRIGRAIEYS